MKLIDKDRLISALASRSYSKKSLELIEKQPEVEAIPVYWIKDWLNRFMKEINGRTYYCGDGYDSAADLLEAWEEEQASLFEKQITEKCTSAERFAEWEKENEKDI